MDEIETNELSNNETTPDSNEGFTFHWGKLIIGAAICYFWLFESWLFILSLAIVVIIHELGHVIVGKYFGCVIEEMQVFLLNFVSYKPKQVENGGAWRNIKWSLGILPLGGFTIFKRKPEFSMDDSEQYVIDNGQSTGSPYIEEKPAWQQLLISAGGVLFNFFTFLVIYLLLSYLPYGWYEYNFCATIMLLSLTLAVLNILPIYPLDGGAIIFSFYEMITGKKPSQSFVNVCGIVGFVIIILFFWIFPDWISSLMEHIYDLFL